MPDGFRKDLALELNEEGRISGIVPPDEKTEVLDGILCPGFINSHCHLELSHMKGKIPRESGMPEFLKRVVMARNEANESEQLPAMKNAEEEMLRNGIVAVGDICNHPGSFEVKAKSALRYHSFIELIGFDPAKAGAVMEKGIELYNELSVVSTQVFENSRGNGLPPEKYGPSFGRLPNSPKSSALSPALSSFAIGKGGVSLSPHAPYSVSGDLVAAIRDFESAHSGLMTIHNQESLVEEEFFYYASGGIMELFREWKIEMGGYKAQRQSSLRSLLPWFGRKGKLMLVHNTFTKHDEIGWAELNHRKIWWCFCPNANLYIEKKLPDIFNFYDEGVRIVLGTDSLASNDQLSVLEEVKTVNKYFPRIPLDEVLQWPTRNAADYFGWEDLGRFEAGRRPGVVHIPNEKNISQAMRLV